VQVVDIDQDVIGLHRTDDLVQLVVVQVRAGKVTGKREFHWNGQELLADDGDLLSSVVVQYYEQGEQIPDEVVLPVEGVGADVLAELLTERRGRKVAVVTPRRGHRAALVELAQKNAEHLASQRRGSNADSEARLRGVAERLGLPAPPRTIECYDIAHHQSGKAVAAMAVLVDGSPESSRTRSFTIKRAKTGDDYGGLYEVLARRFRRAKQGEAGWELPDLLVVDGGRGQLAVAQAALRDAELPGPGPALAGLAKERAARRSPAGDVLKEETVERVYLPNRMNPIAIRGTSPLLLLCQARDEAHRLAGKQLARHRRSRAFGSELEDIPGVGPRLRRALLRHLGSVDAVRAASPDALAAVPGVGPALAARIHEHLNGPIDLGEPSA
jgi:excinuclease ABC subunit C